MTRQEVAAVVAMIRLRWPHSNLGDNLEAVVNLWAMELAPFPAKVVEQSVRRVGRGREHAPTLDVLLADIDGTLGRERPRLPYRVPASSEAREQTAELQARIKARFAAIAAENRRIIMERQG